MFKEIDWIMNESPDAGMVKDLKNSIGDRTQIIQCLVGWDSQHSVEKVKPSGWLIFLKCKKIG